MRMSLAVWRAEGKERRGGYLQEKRSGRFGRQEQVTQSLTVRDSKELTARNRDLTGEMEGERGDEGDGCRRR